MSLGKTSYTKTFIGLALVVAVGAGCSEAESEAAPDVGSADANREIISNLVKAGFPMEDIMVVDDVVYVGRDAAVSLQASREMLQADDSSSEEQYRTNNIVSIPKQNICFWEGAITGVVRTAVSNAIARYNALGLSFLKMRMVSLPNDPSCGAYISVGMGSGSGGSAGFPSFGEPYGRITLGTGLLNFPLSTITHVVMHELGHCIGFRHSDYFDRSISCGLPGNEGPGEMGANHIPGTPTGATVGGSVMNACFRTNESGSFTSSDITALHRVY